MPSNGLEKCIFVVDWCEFLFPIDKLPTETGKPNITEVTGEKARLFSRAVREGTLDDLQFELPVASCSVAASAIKKEPIEQDEREDTGQEREARVGQQVGVQEQGQEEGARQDQGAHEAVGESGEWKVACHTALSLASRCTDMG